RADPFPALSGRHGERRSYTTPWDIIRLKAWSLLAEDFDWWEPGALKLQPQATVAPSPHVFFEFEIIKISGREASAETG
ncbi:hypothetical protein OCK02_26030, partial [Rhizobium sp. TRM96647]|nr:hypothetical protein [Rhizobium sp. TRM96647]MCV3761268.1 hypothetical protein [Rhizobium sp. TRM96650]